MHVRRFAGLLFAAAASALAADPTPLTLSHTWIVVKTGAPERAAGTCGSTGS